MATIGSGETNTPLARGTSAMGAEAHRHAAAPRRERPVGQTFPERRQPPDGNGRVARIAVKTARCRGKGLTPPLFRQVKAELETGGKAAGRSSYQWRVQAPPASRTATIPPPSVATRTAIFFTGIPPCAVTSAAAAMGGGAYPLRSGFLHVVKSERPGPRPCRLSPRLFRQPHALFPRRGPPERCRPSQHQQHWPHQFHGP